MIYEKKARNRAFFCLCSDACCCQDYSSIRTFHLLKGFLTGNHKVAIWRFYINYCYA